jgi:hypothetical protein
LDAVDLTRHRPCERSGEQIHKINGDLDATRDAVRSARGLQILTRYWWPRFVATIGQSRDHGVIHQVIWIDASGNHAEKTIAAAREAFLLR